MCTTGVCNAIYVLTLCMFGWLGTGIMMAIRGRKVKANREFVSPLANSISGAVKNEIVNPLKCFTSEVVNPLRKDLVIILKEWNKNVGSKPELGRVL